MAPVYAAAAVTAGADYDDRGARSGSGAAVDSTDALVVSVGVAAGAGGAGRSRALFWRLRGLAPLRRLRPFSERRHGVARAYERDVIFRRVSWDRYVACEPSPSAASASILSVLTLERDTPVARSTTLERITALRASHDGRFLVGGSATGRCYCWETSTGALLNSGWAAHLRAVRDVAFTDDDDIVVTVSDDGSLMCWHMHDIVAVRNGGDGLDNKDEDADEEEEGRKAAAEEEEERADGWAAPTGVAAGRNVRPCRRVPAAHTMPIVAVAVGYGGSRARLCTIARDRTLKVWHVATGELLGAVHLPHSPTCVAVDSVTEFAAFVGMENGGVERVDLRTMQPAGDAARVIHGGASAAAACAADEGSGVGVGVGTTLTPHRACRVNALALVEDGATLVSAADDGSVAVIDVRTGTVTGVFAGSAAHDGAPVVYVEQVRECGMPLDASSYAQACRRRMSQPSKQSLPSAPAAEATPPLDGSATATTSTATSAAARADRAPGAVAMSRAPTVDARDFRPLDRAGVPLPHEAVIDGGSGAGATPAACLDAFLREARASAVDDDEHDEHDDARDRPEAAGAHSGQAGDVDANDAGVADAPTRAQFEALQQQVQRLRAENSRLARTSVELHVKSVHDMVSELRCKAARRA